MTRFYFTGLSIGIVIILFARKNIRKIILLKGGDSVFIETFGAFGWKLKRNFQLKELTCKVSRQRSKGYVPLRYKGIWFNLLVDTEGEFKNPALFDMTAGMYRDLEWMTKKKK